MKKISFSLICTILPLSALAQNGPYFHMPKGCDYVKESKIHGKKRLDAAITLQASGTLDKGILKKLPEEKAISPKDLDQEIFYHNPVNQSCSFVKVKDTPFGKWAKAEMDRLKQQNLKSLDVSLVPVEIDPAYNASYWRSLPLAAKANFFDRRAVVGYNHLQQEIEKCHNGNSSNKELDELAKTLEKYYGIKP
jgi:hypothetical protein